MAKKDKAKGKGNKNDIGMAFRVQIDGPPKSARAVFRAAIKAADGSGKLPEGVAIEWGWRNSKKQEMRWAPFREVIKKSRSGFRELVKRRLLREALRRFPDFEAPPPPRKATPAELRRLERHEELAEQLREEQGHSKGSNTRARETKEKRSAAAKKGWKTRRAAAQKKGASKRK